MKKIIFSYATLSKDLTFDIFYLSVGYIDPERVHGVGLNPFETKLAHFIFMWILKKNEVKLANQILFIYSTTKETHQSLFGAIMEK